MAMALESPGTFPESPMDQDDVVYPCKGCGEILEEGKAFELAGNRWHIDCFRCNTCGTLLDSDANLLLLGDGSLICNNCTYSCSVCGNKIEDLAILTGDQAFCASCFRCRNCKRKIENLRYARTSQGIFCMSCHESLMAKRRKNKKAAQRQAASTNGLNKSLPELPREKALQSAFAPGSEVDTPPEKFTEPVSEPSSQHQRPARQRKEPSTSNAKREESPASADESRKENLTLPSSTYRGSRMSMTAKNSQPANTYDNTSGDDGLFVPLVLDTNPLAGSSPMPAKSREFTADAPPADVRLPQAKDYFARKPVPQAGRDLVQDTHKETSRSSSVERKQPPSPHIAYQEKSWQPSDHLGDTLRRKKEAANDSSPVPPPSTNPPSTNPPSTHPPSTHPPSTHPPSTNPPSYASAPSSQSDFKLQDVPKSKRAGSHRSSQSKSSAAGSPVVDASLHAPLRDAPRSSSPQQVDSLKKEEASQPPQTDSTPRPSAERPKRGDSLQNSVKQVLSRMDTSSSSSGSTTPNTSTAPVEDRSISAQATELTGPQVNGKSISNPIESPTSRSILDVPSAPPARSTNRPSPAGVPVESFTSPRAAPPPPPTPAERHKASESASTVQTGERSPVNLPRYSTGAEFSMDDDMARILRGDDTQHPESGVLRKMSNAVRHGRSFSDRGTRTASGSAAKWSTKSPRNGSMDISSPLTATSPESREENVILKSQLRRSQQRIAELEAEKNGLQSIVNKTADINHVNSEIREKRSTMAFLDTQREIVVSELEILTDHVKKAKESNKPVDINALKGDIIKDLGASLQKLKDSFTPQIEELIQKRNDLTNEIADLIQMKDKGFQEYESLSTRNAQLTQHNNELIHQIQDSYKANRQPNGQSVEAGRPPPANGLGIQLHNKDKSETSSYDLRTLVGTEGSLSNSAGDNEAESFVSTPQVINIRKQAKANMWKKGTQGLTKGLRGVRGALVSEKPAPHYQVESMPYNHIPNDAVVLRPNEPARRNFGNFFSSEKQGPKLQHLKSSHGNNSNPSLTSDAIASAANLFGSDLTTRCDLEKRVVPSIVTRCIEEVELRGMDVEGIYRKSGGSGQVNQVRMGFEQSNEHDISDPDLDIHAVTSTLKQYFRRLPMPLITFEVYDSLLEATKIEDDTRKAVKMKEAINTLPRCHRDCLEFLVFHLSRVLAKADVNLMTSLNLAVVFAPTIMRPQSIEREMSDMQTQRNAVQSMLEHSKSIFSDS